MHLNYRPIQINTWVDDCPQLHVGTDDFLRTHVTATAKAFAEELGGIGFEVSVKTTVMSSPMQLATHIQTDLRKAKMY